MITSVSISNFKTLEKLENIPLSRFTLIGGKNNTGKTTLLESLFLYCDFRSPDVLDKLFIWREFGGTWLPKELWIKFFNNMELSKKINITTNSDKAENRKIDISYLNDYETTTQFAVTENGVTSLSRNFPALEIMHTTNDSNDYKAHLLDLKLSYTYLRDIDLLQDPILVFYMGARMSLYFKNTEYLGIIDKTDEQEKILPLLRIFEPNLVRLQLIDECGNKIIYADFGNKNKIPVNLLGDGFCRCMTIALILASKETNIFLIDEVGSGIHYSVHEDVWKFLLKASELYNCQIITTTHSHDTIKAFNKVINNENITDASYIRLGRKDDEIKAHIMPPDLLDYSLSSNLEVR